ncbi:MAG: GNAT family N-acetyltransferase [Candidatus Nomurabacteria bacterium]|nr:GNAT family N-acetyltransferase [Candidatus Nomurabacteria bacterium]
MQIITKKSLEKFSLSLPIYSDIKIADATSKEGDNFYIFAGLDKEKVLQLKTLSLDESDKEIQKNTSDRKRFGLGLYEDWYKKGRTPFALIHKNTNKLAALIWFGAETLEGEKGNFHTSAWRSYPGFRGKGLMKEFANFAMNFYAEKIPDVKFWAKIRKENIGSIGFAQAIGFKKMQENPDGDFIVMVKR